MLLTGSLRCHVERTASGMRPRAPCRHLFSPRCRQGASPSCLGARQQLKLRTRSNESLGETSASMTAAALLALIKRADETISYEQLRTWVVAQAVRNA